MFGQMACSQFSDLFICGGARGKENSGEPEGMLPNGFRFAAGCVETSCNEEPKSTSKLLSIRKDV